MKNEVQCLACGTIYVPPGMVAIPIDARGEPRTLPTLSPAQERMLWVDFTGVMSVHRGNGFVPVVTILIRTDEGGEDVAVKWPECVPAATVARLLAQIGERIAKEGGG